MSFTAMDKCLAYARKIRNLDKRRYAIALIFNWGNRNAMPRGPLSSMGSQAVMMSLAEIVKGIDG